MVIYIVNLTNDPLSYGSGVFTVGANDSEELSENNYIAVLTDGSLFSDISQNNINVTDGTNTYSYGSAESYIQNILNNYLSTNIASVNGEIVESLTFTGTDTLEINTLGYGVVTVSLPDIDFNNQSVFFETSHDGSSWQSVFGTDLGLLDGQLYNQTTSLNFGPNFQFNVAGTAYFRGRALDFPGEITIRIGTSTSSSTINAILSYVYTKSDARDGNGNSLTSTLIGSNRGLDVTAQGNIASGSSDSGNPVKIGGKYNTALPTITNGQRGDLQLDSNARVIISPLANTSIVKSQLQDNAGTAITLGQKAMAASIPVVFPSDQSIGGGTEYTEGSTDASITGSAILWEDTSDTLRAVSEAKPLPVNIVAGSAAGTEYTEGSTDASITGTVAMMEVAADTLQPVQGTVADGLLVNLGSNNDVTVTSGSITANAGTNLNTSTLALEAGGNLAGAATSLAIIDDWDESDRAKVNPIVGQAGVQGGSGTVSALTQRVVLATDVALPTGSNVIGAVTQSGTWNVSLGSSAEMYVFEIPSQVHVAVANTIHWDLFNADAAKIVRIMGIYQLPNIVTAVTGIAFSWEIYRTSAVGTGGSALTAWLPDLSQTALDADITLRSKPTGGATTSGAAIKNYTIHSEETNAATQMMHMMMAGGVANLVPAGVADSSGIVLRQDQGIKCVQVTNSNAGNTGWCICFSVE